MGKLLRLAKRNKHTLPILKKHEAVHETFVPLLTPENGEQLVVHTELVTISSGILDFFQSEQVCRNTKRGSILIWRKRTGRYLKIYPLTLLFYFSISKYLPLLLGS